MINNASKSFERDVYCLLGVPIDNMTIQTTKDYLRSKTDQKNTTVWSTVNVNWIVQSLHDEGFYKAIINSDLVTIDGKPLLWLSKILGYPMKEVVPGSSIIQELHEDQGATRKVSIYFFGGEENVGTIAMQKVNAQSNGLKAVGALNPGFGSVEEMSGQAIIDEINKANPDILLVALGAQKGTAWIEHNRDRLNAKIISHLGATVNFLAGTVKRAPTSFQKLGMEWFWRILQEPKLFSRYASDGWILFCWVVKKLPVWFHFHRMKRKFENEKYSAEITEDIREKQIRLSFGTAISATNIASIRQTFFNCALTGKDVILDFQKTKYVCGGFMALVLILKKNLIQNGGRLEIVNVQEPFTKLFRFFLPSQYILLTNDEDTNAS